MLNIKQADFRLEPWSSFQDGRSHFVRDIHTGENVDIYEPNSEVYLKEYRINSRNGMQSCESCGVDAMCEQCFLKNSVDFGIFGDRLEEDFPSRISKSPWTRDQGSLEPLDSRAGMNGYDFRSQAQVSLEHGGKQNDLTSSHSFVSLNGAFMNDQYSTAVLDKSQADMDAKLWPFYVNTEENVKFQGQDIGLSGDLDLLSHSTEVTTIYPDRFMYRIGEVDNLQVSGIPEDEHVEIDLNAFGLVESEVLTRGVTLSGTKPTTRTDEVCHSMHPNQVQPVIFVDENEQNVINVMHRGHDHLQEMNRRAGSIQSDQNPLGWRKCAFGSRNDVGSDYSVRSKCESAHDVGCVDMMSQIKCALDAQMREGAKGPLNVEELNVEGMGCKGQSRLNLHMSYASATKMMEPHILSIPLEMEFIEPIQLSKEPLEAQLDLLEEGEDCNPGHCQADHSYVLPESYKSCEENEESKMAHCAVVEKYQSDSKYTVLDKTTVPSIGVVELEPAPSTPPYFSHRHVSKIASQYHNFLNKGDSTSSWNESLPYYSEGDTCPSDETQSWTSHPSELSTSSQSRDKSLVVHPQFPRVILYHCQSERIKKHRERRRRKKLLSLPLSNPKSSRSAHAQQRPRMHGKFTSKTPTHEIIPFTQ